MGHTSIAIDSFPVMTDEAIEAYWIKMVENHRQSRRELFDLWESSDSADMFSKEDLKRHKAKHLRELIRQHPSNTKLHDMVQEILDERYEALVAQEHDKIWICSH